MKHMTKAQRLEYMKKRFAELEEMSDAVLPVTKNDIEEEIHSMDTYREHIKDEATDHEALTSDAI